MRTAVPIILETDMGNDIDDALALALLHRLQSLGECRILAVTVNKGAAYAACFVDLLNAFYGRGGIPVGLNSAAPTPEPGKFAQEVAELRDGWGRLLYQRRRFESTPPPDAVDILRQTLARADDASVVIVSIGFFTNLAKLLDSGPDAASPLSGRDLLARKVRFVSAMAGDFSEEARTAPRPEHREFNVHVDPDAARHFIEDAPAGIVFAGYELGLAARYPATSVLRDYEWAAPRHPLVDAYHLYSDMPYDRPTWDLISAIYAVRPEADYFTLSPAGEVTVDADAVTRFAPRADGRHRYLSFDAAGAARLVGLFEALCSSPP